MKNTKELLKKIEGKDVSEQARIINEYIADSRRKKAVEEARRDIRNKCFAGCKKLTKAQQESYLYEFLNANCGYISNWMIKNHSELTDNK